MKPQIGLGNKQLHGSIALLETVLSDETVLYMKTRKFHWNVSGNSFMEIHKLFEGQYNELEEVIDAVAERINKLGGKNIGTLAEFLKNTRLKESPGKYPDQMEMMKELLADHEALIVHLRKDVAACAEKIEDAGTADFLTGLMEAHETTAWKLRRYFN